MGDAFLQRLFDLDVVCRHLLAGAAVDHDGFGRAEAAGGAGGVHGGVAAAVDRDPPAEQGRFSVFHIVQHGHRVHDPGRIAGRDVRAPADVRADCDEGSVITRLELGLDVGDRGVVFGVQRHRGVVLGPAMGVGVLGVLREQPGTVPQDDLGQLGGVAGRDHRPGKALPRQRGQVSAVVEVRMGEDHGIDVAGPGAERFPVAPPEVRCPLEQPAVQQHPGPAAVNKELAAGHRARAAEKGQRRPRYLVDHGRH
jgi:hypothetical protein